MMFEFRGRGKILKKLYRAVVKAGATGAWESAEI